MTLPPWAVGLDGRPLAAEASADPLLLLGWTGALADALAASGTEPARVRRVDRGRIALLARDGSSSANAPAGAPLVPGDWVALDAGGRIVATLPRDTLLRRQSADGHGVQLLAANVDLVLVVRPLDTSLAPHRLLQLAELAWDAGAEPAIVLTKADRHDDARAAVAAVEHAAPGVPALATSTLSGVGLSDLSELVRGRSTALVGESGAGKSTLVNALLAREAVVVGPVRADGQGRHTTTWRELLVLPGGGTLIDTPGMRVVHAVSDGGGYGVIDDLAARCRFSDCRHEAEPGCAVHAALAAGEFAPEILLAYRRALRDAAWRERQADPLAMSAERRRWRASERAGREDAERKRGRER